PWPDVDTTYPLLHARGQLRVGDGDVEPARAVARIRAGAVVRGERDHRPHEGGRGDDVEGGLGNGREPALGHEVARPYHFPRVRLDEPIRGRVIGAEPIDHLLPRLPSVEACGPAGQIRLD